jgi:hypothetical protein
VLMIGAFLTLNSSVGTGGSQATRQAPLLFADLQCWKSL